MDNFQVQTRSEKNGLAYFNTFAEAVKHADKHQDVWKISFPLPTGERVRLILSGNEWVYEDIWAEWPKEYEDCNKTQEPS